MSYLIVNCKFTSNFYAIALHYLVESILQDVLKLINDAMGYLRLFVIGGTAFFVAKDYALKMASSDDNQKARYDRKIKTTIIAGVSALVTTQFVS